MSRRPNLTNLQFIALAALTTKLTIIDGVLMQSATKTGYDNDERRIAVQNAITANMHQEFPVTGWVSPGNNGPGFMTPELRENVKSWQTNLLAPELSDDLLEGCEGIYFTNVTGIGFEFECDEPRVTDIDWARFLVNETSVRGIDQLWSPQLPLVIGRKRYSAPNPTCRSEPGLRQQDVQDRFRSRLQQ